MYMYRAASFASANKYPNSPQTWNKREALHDPENFIINFAQQNFSQNHRRVRKAENCRTTKKKRLCGFSKILEGFEKQKIIARLKKQKKNVLHFFEILTHKKILHNF